MQIHRIHKIHQVFILDNDALPDVLPEMVRINAECARKIYPNAELKIWGGKELKRFIAENFEPDVLWAYNTLVPYSFKCDLARFCLMYVYGGIYIDLGIRLMNSWDIPITKGVAAFRDVSFVSNSWSTMQTGLLFSIPGRPEFKKAIDFIVENCRNKYYGENPLYPTGPILLGRAFIAAMVEKGQSEAADDQQVGSCRCVTPDAYMLNVSYVSKEGTLVALRTKKAGGDLKHMGVSGSNNYNDIWRARQAYGETEHTWKSDDISIVVEDRAKRTSKGIEVARGASGRVSWGPMATLDAGHYLARIDFDQETEFSRFFIDICAQTGSNVVHEFECNFPSIEKKGFIDFEFSLPNNSSNIEIRPHVFGDFNGTIKSFSFRKIHRKTWNSHHTAIKLIGVSKNNTGVYIPKGTKGRVIYGPYVDLSPGEYSLKAKFAAGTKFSQLLIDVGAGHRNETISLLSHRTKRSRHYDVIEFVFELDKIYSNVEFRMHVEKDFEGTFIEYELLKKDQ